MESSVDKILIDQSKKQCAENGISENQRFFTYPEDMVTHEPKSAVCLRDNVFLNILPLFETYAHNYGAVMYYAHQDGFIYNEFGAPELLEYFRNCNLTIGSSIKDQHIGTTAASFVKPGADCYIVGKDHHVEVFHEYASYCLQHTKFARNMYILMIMPVHKLNNSFIAYMRMSHTAMQCALNAYLTGLDNKLKLLSYHSQHDSSAILTIDLFGTIIGVNMQFYTWFNTEPDKVKELNCFDVLPELRCIEHDLITGKAVAYEHIHFNNTLHNMQHLSVETKPIFRGIKWLGSLIIISNEPANKKITNTKQQYTFNHIVGDSRLMRQIKQNAMNAAQTNSHILITGESGTGKEYFAQAIHKESSRKDMPFVSINCSAMSAELISSELFGYVEGAFTGGKKGGAIGKFEYANHGTIFLDEIGDMPISVQAILLRVLEEKTIYKLGSNKQIPIDVNIICATHRNLKEMVRESTFRLDLYYRINVININLPPLRDRKEDLPQLLDCHLDKYNIGTHKIIKGFTPAAMQRLLSYNWPGNIRELRNMIEYGASNTVGYIDVCDLPNDILENMPIEEEDKQIKFFISSEREQLLSLMLKHNGNKSKVAKQLGMSRGTLYKKLEEHQILTQEPSSQPPRSSYQAG